MNTMKSMNVVVVEIMNMTKNTNVAVEIMNTMRNTNAVVVIKNMV
jgi:hypothetical protein